MLTGNQAQHTPAGYPGPVPRPRLALADPFRRALWSGVPRIWPYIKITEPLVHRIQEISPACHSSLSPFPIHPTIPIPRKDGNPPQWTVHGVRPHTAVPRRSVVSAQNSSMSSRGTLVTASYNACRTCGTLRPRVPICTLLSFPRDRQVGGDWGAFCSGRISIQDL